MIQEILYDKIIGRGIDLVEKIINKKNEDSNRNKLWEKAFVNAAKSSEMISEAASKELSKHRTLRSFFI